MQNEDNGGTADGRCGDSGGGCGNSSGSGGRDESGGSNESNQDGNGDGGGTGDLGGGGSGRITSCAIGGTEHVAGNWERGGTAEIRNTEDTKSGDNGGGREGSGGAGYDDSFGSEGEARVNVDLYGPTARGADTEGRGRVGDSSDSRVGKATAVMALEAEMVSARTTAAAETEAEAGSETETARAKAAVADIRAKEQDEAAPLPRVKPRATLLTRGGDSGGGDDDEDGEAGDHGRVVEGDGCSRYGDSGDGTAGVGTLGGEEAGVNTAAVAGRSAHNGRNGGGGRDERGEMEARTGILPRMEKVKPELAVASTARKEQATEGEPAAGEAAAVKAAQDGMGSTILAVETR